MGASGIFAVDRIITQA